MINWNQLSKVKWGHVLFKANRQAATLCRCHGTLQTSSRDDKELAAYISLKKQVGFQFLLSLFALYLILLLKED